MYDLSAPLTVELVHTRNESAAYFNGLVISHGWLPKDFGKPLVRIFFSGVVFETQSFEVWSLAPEPGGK